MYVCMRIKTEFKRKRVVKLMRDRHRVEKRQLHYLSTTAKKYVMRVVIVAVSQSVSQSVSE